ncbi:cation:proton antiporter domain-containing protein [Massilia endophytica]|uniref:cation:proton antiporter domain-containing protein n=1 Tax=Massilia endophytica TaxID=2899220 RepID=UPI001E4311F8|nr:cation:proton antiporter [Massilia endophytica]UGQ48705.1 cation:proton antiporter [Massilia endophytica]
MEAHSAVPHLREILIFLLMAGVLVPLLQRFRINQVLGFLAAGLAVGPNGLVLLADQFPWLAYVTIGSRDSVAAIGELGILFMMFMIGLELSPARLWSWRRWVFGAGLAQLGVTAAFLGALAYLFGNPTGAALVVGLTLALSSTAIVMQLLSNRHELGSTLGKASFSILMMQDLAVVPLLIMLPLLGHGAGLGIFAAIGLALLKGAITILALYFLGGRLVPPLYARLATRQHPESFLALTLLLTLGVAGVTALAGLSMALGALLAGLLLADTEYRFEVEVLIEPFKGLLMGLFFVSVGMQVDLREILLNPLWLPLSVLGLLLIKAAVAMGILRAGGMSWGRSIEGGVLLGQGGEFAFIVLGYAVATGVLEAPVSQFMVTVVSLSMFLSPAVARLGTLGGKWVDQRMPRPSEPPAALPPSGMTEHVVIAGYGRIGQLIGKVLSQQGIPFVALEQDYQLVGTLAKAGHPVYSGDASMPELLAVVNARHAAAVVLTMDNPPSAVHAAQRIRQICPGVPVFARARDPRHAVMLKTAGARQVIPETFETGLQLAAFVLEASGVPDSAAQDLVEAQRDELIAAFEQKAS